MIYCSRRQLSRESLLRSASRCAKMSDSRDSLDRWVENGIRSRGVWRKLEEDSLPPPPPPIVASSSGAGVSGHGNGRGYYNHEFSSSVEHLGSGAHGKPHRILPSTPRRLGELGPGKNTPLLTRTATNLSTSRLDSTSSPSKRAIIGKGYRELSEQERYPGLDRETARVSHHSSNLNLSHHQHIYSEPSYETSLLVPHSQPNSKSKKFSFAFWKN